MKVLNTLTRRMEEFVPMDGKSVRMYTCGPTVYDFAHIGNFRAYAFEDLLRRYLRYRGFSVTQVMNLTDVDDKTIRGARAAGVSLDSYTRIFKDAFFADLKVLGIEAAEHYPEATRHIPEMIAMIKTLLDRGAAYRSEDGSIYFRIASFPGYGRLAQSDLKGMKAGARVAHDEYDKESAADFALWKAWDETDGDVVWDSPWGRGRPGWHIECSAMSTKYLGESFDIHTGGIDNMFPHHENEIAQSEAATGKQFVKYWMHCAHLVVDGRKMSKSLGNFYTLRQIIERGYTGREIRALLLSAQYRQSLNFTFEGLDGIRAALGRIDDFADRVKRAGGDGTGTLPGWALKARETFIASLDDDLNVSGALAAVFDMIHDGNRAMDGGVPGGDLQSVTALLAEFDGVLGFIMPVTVSADEEVQNLMKERELARGAKNWGESDRIRKSLADLGWDVRDTPAGPQLKRRA
jgi:cysteinyl-tRNA synthetase